MKSKWKTAEEQTKQNKRRNERGKNEAKKRKAIAELGQVIPAYRRKPVITHREHRIVEHMLAKGIFEIPDRVRPVQKERAGGS
jgi:predicted transcriptional regulator YheO